MSLLLCTAVRLRYHNGRGQRYGAEEKVLLKSVLHSCYFYDQINGYEEGGTYTMHVTRKTYKDLVIKLKYKSHTEDLGINGRIILK